MLFIYIFKKTLRMLWSIKQNKNIIYISFLKTSFYIKFFKVDPKGFNNISFDLCKQK